MALRLARGTPAAALAAALIWATPARAQEPDLTTSAVNEQIAAGLRQDNVNVKGLLADSLRLLALEHGFRLAFQPHVRRALEGPFWIDYARSVRIPRQWDDGDSWMVNYVGHPIHGAAAAFLFIHNDPESRAAEFGLNRHYWATRWRPVTFAAIFSVQFEIGPLSEASIGNVGMRPETTGWVDYVVTPLGAMAFMVAEEALDRYLVKWVEERTENLFVRASLRLLCGPSQMMANFATGRLPWHRDTRPIRSR